MKRVNDRLASRNVTVGSAVIVFLLFVMLFPFSVRAEAVISQFPPVLRAIPAVYGEIIYRCNESSTDQIYIIGMSHRDTFTRENSINSVDSQVEVFRIAEWMVRNEDLELLLPEGFFFRTGEESVSDEWERATRNNASPDQATLRKKLGSNSVYANAEMVLMENYGMKSRQVEDEGLYNAVRAGVRLLADKKINKYEALYIMSGIDYLQERRTAAMLQKIPDIVDSEFTKGGIKNRKAIFTMGLDHIPEIIRYLDEKHIVIHAPPFFDMFDDYFAEVKLLKENFGVTVIIPRSLSETQDIIRLTRLEHVSPM